MKKLSFLLFAILLISACGKKQQSELASIETDRFAVQSERVTLRDVSQELLLTGTVKAWEEATIFPRVDGKLFKNVLKEGDRVKKNETLALIERDEVGAVYEPVVVPSTLTGIIGRTYLDPGANVTKTTPIALVVNQEDVRILIEIPERYVGQIHLNQKATFTLEAYGPQTTFEAVIYKLSPVVDMQSRVVSAELKASNKEGLIKSGMFAKVRLLLDSAYNVPSVSIPALFKDPVDGNTYVFVINADDTVTKTLITPGLVSDKFGEIRSGIKEGAQVARVVFGLKDKSKIKVENK